MADRLASLRAARGLLAELGQICGASPVYESDAMGGPTQGRFLNAAVEIATALEPAPLLDRLLSIERQLGRIRRERWGPRTLDLDLLWSGQLVVRGPELSIPHPRLAERTFALRPLLDVRADAWDPASGEPYVAALARLAEPALRPICGRDDWRPDVHHAPR